MKRDYQIDKSLLGLLIVLMHLEAATREVPKDNRSSVVDFKKKFADAFGEPAPSLAIEPKDGETFEQYMVRQLAVPMPGPTHPDRYTVPAGYCFKKELAFDYNAMRQVGWTDEQLIQNDYMYKIPTETPMVSDFGSQPGEGKTHLADDGQEIMKALDAIKVPMIPAKIIPAHVKQFARIVVDSTGQQYVIKRNVYHDMRSQITIERPTDDGFQLERDTTTYAATHFETMCREFGEATGDQVAGIFGLHR